MNRWMSTLAALSIAASARAAEPKIPFEKYQLPNGLTVILSEDHSAPQVAVDVWYHVGVGNQAPGRSGFAHLFEHMMLSGARHIGNDAFRAAEELGAPAGRQSNGTTSEDRTNYFEILPSSQLPGALWLESDRMAYSLETIDERKLAIQRDVVSNERRQSYENTPYGMVWLKLCNLLYPAPHPNHQCVIGSIDEIQSASMADLQSFFKQFYGPGNATLAVVGDFNPAEAKALIEKYFGTIPARPTVAPPQVVAPQLKGVVRERVDEKVAKLPRLVMAWNGQKPLEPGTEVGDLLGTVLAEGKSSRLYRRLVFEKQIATDVSAYNDTSGVGGSFQIMVTAKAGRTTDELLTEVQAVLAELRAKGVSAEELARAKRLTIAQLLRSAERIGAFGGKADLLSFYEMWTGDPGYLPKLIARYRAVTPQQLQAHVREKLPEDRVLILDVVPTSATATAEGKAR